MNELIHIKDKINTRIKSIGNDEKGVYAKRMMRRCIKDIDKVVEAKNKDEKIRLAVRSAITAPEEVDKILEAYGVITEKRPDGIKPNRSCLEDMMRARKQYFLSFLNR